MLLLSARACAEARTHTGAVLDTNRFYQCRHGKHRASGTAIWQLSDITSERSGVPWELES